MEKLILYILEKLKNIYSLYLMVLILGIGCFSIWIDTKKLKNKKLDKEAKLCKTIGVVYIIGGIGVYFILKII